MHSVKSSADLAAVPRPEWLSPQLVPVVNQFYRSQGQKDKARKDERIAVIRSENKAIIAAVRISPRADHQLVRALQVASGHQGQGLARTLMQFALAEQTQPLWCFALAHLNPFYVSLGFQPLTMTQAPAEIAQIFNAYHRYQALSLLSFHPAAIKAQT